MPRSRSEPSPAYGHRNSLGDYAPARFRRTPPAHPMVGGTA
ncbi:hypothetical protein HMPREF3193_00633 [Bifidobacterium breve]|nr:hypothetical protein HMPREF1587_02332 [Bifidobacterium breve JCP7499]KWZ85999.1 hypothetical protein HMPREF3193_00633 [Bifidobacterium breve]